MSKESPIQWCDSTVNPTMGCDGCEIWQKSENGRRSCYAGALHDFRGGRPGYAKRFELVEQFPGRMRVASRWSDLTGTKRLGKPWLDGLPRLIFVSDMGDSLSKAVPFEYLRDEVIENAGSVAGRRHRWLWLTKQPKRMAQFAEWLRFDQLRDWPENLWAGTSITTQATAMQRIRHLMRVRTDTGLPHLFLSVEPQVGRVGLMPRVQWVIQGGESGKDPRPFDLTWADTLRNDCAEMQIPYFLKQLGANAVVVGERFRTRDTHGGDWSEWPENLRVRQMPAALLPARDAVLL